MCVWGVGFELPNQVEMSPATPLFLLVARATSTALYTHIILNHGTDEYTSKVAVTIDEMKTLIEQGFDYITDKKVGETTYKLFRKKKSYGTRVR